MLRFNCRTESSFFSIGAFVAALVLGMGCGSSEESSSFGGSKNGGGSFVNDGGKNGNGNGNGSLGGGDASAEFQKIPVRQIPGLQSVTYYEKTGPVQQYTFTLNSREMTTRLNELNDGSRDFGGADTEFYDVFYSDEDGNFDVDGSYLTITGVYGRALPAGGALNLSEISLNYDPGSGSAKEFGNYVASSVALGDNGTAASVANAIDGNLETWTSMGNTIGQTDRLRITLGFKKSSGDPPPPR